jgi:UDP-glucose 4-epimerase
MPLRGASPQAYTGMRARRVADLPAAGRTIWGMDFGSDSFLTWLRNEPAPDLFCHHASVVSGHQSDAFDVDAAVSQNVRQFPELIALLKRQGCRGIVFTGTYYERDEGAGTIPLRAFSPYAVSKTLSYKLAQDHCRAASLPLGKFVMPNPFGLLEEKGFTLALRRSWLAGEPMQVRTPDYIRDNIHIDLLALAYESFCRSMISNPEGLKKVSPSGYIESQGAFALRFQKEFRARTGLPCALKIDQQSDFREPSDRHNLEPAAGRFPLWSESLAWDRIASSPV